MILVLFITIIMVDFLLFLGVAISTFFPKRRIWPPPTKASWQFWISWIFSAIGMIGSPLVGILDFGTLGYGPWLHFLIGGLAILVGGGIAMWGTTTLSAHQSLGLKGKLVTEGSYQYSRNSQYVGFIILYVGIVLVTASFMALITGAFVIFLFLVIPFSEEPWLRQQYGKPYEDYCKTVPRFIGLRSFKPAIPKRQNP